MKFLDRFFGMFSPIMADINRTEKKAEERAKQRGREVVGIFTEAKFREKYFEARRVLEKGGLTDLQKNRMLKRAIFFRDVSRGVIKLNSKEEREFEEEDKRVSKLIREEEES